MAKLGASRVQPTRFNDPEELLSAGKLQDQRRNETDALQVAGRAANLGPQYSISRLTQMARVSFARDCRATLCAHLKFACKPGQFDTNLKLALVLHL